MKPRLRLMVRRSPGTEPAVVRGVEQVVRPVGAIYHFAGKDDLVTDLRTHQPETGQIDTLRPRPRPEIEIARHQSRQAYGR